MAADEPTPNADIDTDSVDGVDASDERTEASA